MANKSESILLGVCDEHIADGSTVDFTVSKIGGLPNMVGQMEPLKCTRCNQILCHVVQLYCPLSSSPYHRTVYVFACVNKNCMNRNDSWRVVRIQVLDTASTYALGEPEITWDKSNDLRTDNLFVNPSGNDWCDDADDWGDEDDPLNNLTNTSSNNTVNFQNNEKTPSFNEWCEEADDWGDSPVTDKETCSHQSGAEKVSGDLEESENTDCVAVENCFAEEVNILSDKLSGIINHVESDPPEGDTDGIVKGADAKLEKQEEDLSNGDKSQAFSGHPLKDELDELSHDYKKVALSDTSLAVNEKERLQFVSYYLNVYEEPDPSADNLKYEKKLLKEYSQREGVDVHYLADQLYGEGGGGEVYEKSQYKHGDRFFYKFMKRVSLCPQQCIRYSYDGKPLLMRQVVDMKPSPCQFCGGQRVFEFQLMPGLVRHLKNKDDPDIQLEFGTVLVYTCVNSCWSDTGSDIYREECTVLQTDPDQHLFK